MPQIAAAVVVAISYVGSATAAVVAGTATLAQIATVAAVGIGAGVGSMAAAKALTPEIGSQGAAVRWEANPDAPLRFAFGRVGVKGNIVDAAIYGPDRMYVSFACSVSAAGPIKRFVSFRAGDYYMSFDGAGAAINEPYRGEMWLSTRLGTQPDTALSLPSGLKNGVSFPGWDATRKMSGSAGYLVTLGENSKRSAYEGKIPAFVTTIEGLFCYDPRQDSTYPGGAGSCRLNDPSTWVWTQNPILFALKWALGLWEGPSGKGAPQVDYQVGGIGAKVESIRLTTVVEAANIADANGWTSAAWPSTDDDKAQVLDGFLKAAGARYAEIAGQIAFIHRAAPRAPVFTVRARDTAGPVEIDTASSKLNRFNTVRPRFWSEANGWEMTALPEVTATEWQIEDGQGVAVKRTRGADYTFVVDPKQTRELASLEISNSREGIRGRVPLRPYMDPEPGNTFIFDEPDFALSNLKCFVLDVEDDTENDTVIVTFETETDGKYPYAYGQTGSPPPAQELDPRDPFFVTPPLPGDWVITPRPPSGDGTQQPGFDLTGLVSNATATAIIVETGPSANGPWTQAYQGPPTVTNIPIDGLQPGATYFIAIQYQRSQNYSEREVFGPFTAPDLIAGDVSPSAPTIVAMQDAINLAEEGIGTINTAVASLNATVYTAGTGLKARSDAMFASLNTPTTGVLARLTATETAISTNNTAAVERLNALEATVNTAGTGLTARLATAESAITANNNAATSRLSALEATVNTAGTGLSARVAGLQTAVSDLNSGKANASDLATLQTEVTTARGGAASLNTRLNTVESTVAGKASASNVSALEATVNAAGTGLLARTLAAESAIVDLQGQKADASRVTALEAKAGGFNKQRNPRWLNGWDAWPIRIGAWSYSALLGGDASWALFGPATAGETALLYGEMIPWGENQPIGLLGRRYANGITSGVLQIYIGCYDAAGNSTGTRQAVQFFNGGYPAGQAVGAQTFAGQVGQLTPPGTTQVRVQIEAVGVNAGAYLGLYYVMPTDDPRRAFTDDATAQSAYSRVASLETATSNLQAGKADASRVTSLEAIVNTPGTGVAARLTNVESVAASADGRAKAIKGVVLDVNGYVSGYSSTNDGTSAAFEVSADKFGIRAPGSGERTEYRAGNWYVYSPSENTRTRYGKAFGGDQKLVWWTGPTSVEEGSETKGNAYVYMSQNTVGGPRFGGSDVIGPGGALTATANTGFIGGGRSGAGYVNTSNQVTVTVSGGTSGATIRWTRISGDSRIQMNNATAFTTGAYATIGAGEVISAYFMGSITKGGQSAVVYVQVDLSDNGT